VILKHLRLYQFRCYENLEFYPDHRFNVITGLNGQGKTSILEAVGLVAFLKSFRNAKNGEMLRLGQTEGLVSGTIQTPSDLTYQLAVKLWPKRKQATFNGKVCKFLSEYVGRISAVSFSPSDLEIIRSGPENRRNWVDKLSQIFEPSHADAVSRYSKILDHRNRELKAVASGARSRLADDFDTWTDELIQWGSRIIHNRIHSVDKTVDIIQKYYTEIAHEQSDVNALYLTDIFSENHSGQASRSSLELISQALKNALSASLNKERILGTTTVGPHRDDLELSLNSNSIRSFGSQGEIRSLVLAMRLAEVEITHRERGFQPILLIDDFSSELDARRRKYLLDYLVASESQVFLSTTEDLNLGKRFLVHEGRIVPHDDGYYTDGQQQL